MAASVPSAPPSWRLTAETLADYLVEIGGTLVSYGCPSYRLEEVIRVVADLEGFTAQAFAIPTGLFVSVQRIGASGPHAAPILRMVRV